MKLGDIYKSKTSNRIIQIESYATHMGRLDGESLVIFTQIINSETLLSICPSFNGYGTADEIEEEYDLLVPQEDLCKYDSFEEILKLTNK